MIAGTVVLSSARTPFGKLGGALAPLSATTLGGEAVRQAVARAGIDAGAVEHVIMGLVLQAGAGQAPARQAAFKAGLAKTTTAETLNKLCASGLVAVAHAARLINAGAHEVIVAGGMESMSNVPYLLLHARYGYRFGAGELADGLLHDGLSDYYFDETMAAQATRVAAELGITRRMQDELAYRSHQRAHAASANDASATGIVPLRVATKQRGKIVVSELPRAAASAGTGSAAGDGPWDHVPPATMIADPARFSPYLSGDAAFALIDRDEAVRAETSLDTLAHLRPLEAGGSITAGNAPGVNDGAAALVLAGAAYAQRNGLTPLATIEGHAGVAWDPPYLCLTPAMAAAKLLARFGFSVRDIAVWEINEAFAAVAVAAATRLGLDVHDINRHGGAVAMGHPVGASGARIVASVVRQLHARGGGLGIAAICSGSGQGDALLVRVA